MFLNSFLNSKGLKSIDNRNTGWIGVHKRNIGIYKIKDYIYNTNIGIGICIKEIYTRKMQECIGLGNKH